jgi:xylulokinase
MYLGIDIGTSGVKAVLIDGKGRIVASATSGLTVSRPHPGWSEQRPEDWWKVTNAAVLKLKRVKPKAVSAVEGIGLSGQQHGATILNKADKPLRPAILWNDARSFAECEEIEAREPRSRAITGNIALAGYTAPKLAWVKKHEPKIFAQTAKVLLPKDYVRLCMTGEYASDMSDSSGTLWLNIAKRTWSDEMLAATDLSRDHMPKLYEGTEATGKLTPAVAKAWGMPKRPVVAGGGGDNASSACGIGAVKDDAAFISLGTSGVFFVSNDTFRPNAGRAIHAFCHAVPETWHQMGVILSAAGSLEWLAGLLKTPAPKLTEAIGGKIKGPSPVLFLPYLSGERTPVADARARGILMRLGHESDAKSMTHAVLDGVAFAFRDSLEALGDAGTKVTRAMAVGGGTRSNLWMKIIASVLQIPIDIPEAGDFGGAYGAARLGLIAATGASFKEICTPPRIAKSIKPDPRLVSAYQEAYQAYAKIYPLTREVARV